MLSELAALIDANADELTMLDVAENGSPVREMRNDARIASWTLRYAAGLALEVRGQTVPSEATTASGKCP